MKRCPLDGYALQFSTNGNGELVESCTACTRRRAHLCMDCGLPTIGRAWRCEFHWQEAKRASGRKHDLSNRRKRRAAARRAYWKVPGRREKACERKKDWRKKNPLKAAMHKRTGRLNGTWGYRSREAFLEAMGKQNARRRERKQDWAKNNQSTYFKDGKPIYPRCAKCGGIIKWDRRGRPKKYHVQCNPWIAGDRDKGTVIQQRRAPGERLVPAVRS
jgi:hypothetical protein